MSYLNTIKYIGINLILIREAKIQFYKNNFNSVSYNLKATWKLINEVIGSN